MLFLIVLAMALTVVLAIFGLVIAIIFALYPESVLSVWIEIPLAVAIGFWVYQAAVASCSLPSLIALGRDVYRDLCRRVPLPHQLG